MFAEIVGHTHHHRRAVRTPAADGVVCRGGHFHRAVDGQLGNVAGGHRGAAHAAAAEADQDDVVREAHQVAQRAAQGFDVEINRVIFRPQRSYRVQVAADAPRLVGSAAAVILDRLEARRVRLVEIVRIDGADVLDKAAIGVDELDMQRVRQVNEFLDAAVAP